MTTYTDEEREKSWIPGASLPDNFPGQVIDAAFEKNLVQQTGKDNVNLWLTIRDADTSEDHRQMWSIGATDAWDIMAGGQELRPAKNQKVLNESSKAGKLMGRVLEEIAKVQLKKDTVTKDERGAGAKVLSPRGHAFQSKAWVGLNFSLWKQEDLIYKGMRTEEGTKDVETQILLPSGFLGFAEAKSPDQEIPVAVMLKIKEIMAVNSTQPLPALIGLCFGNPVVQGCPPAMFAITQKNLLQDIQAGKV